MRTRKAGKAEPAGEALRRVGGVRKPKGKRGGAVVSKKITLRSRTAGGSRGASEPEQQHGEQHLVDLTAASDAEEEEQQQQQLDEQRDRKRLQPRAAASQQQRQQPASSRKRRGSAAVTGDAEESIESLSTEALQEVFLALSRHDQQSYCRCGRRAQIIVCMCGLNCARWGGQRYLPWPPQPIPPPLQGNPAPGVQALP